MELDGRIPPQAPDFEEAVLGAILLEKDAYARVSEKIRPETFYVKAHELIYTAMVTLSPRNVRAGLYKILRKDKK